MEALSIMIKAELIAKIHREELYASDCALRRASVRDQKNSKVIYLLN